MKNELQMSGKPPTNETMVNYISYGSNTHYDRFRLYIEGGQAKGSTHVHEGCDDKTLPPAGRPVVIRHRLYFKYDDWWDGGTAFIDAAPNGGESTLAVAYRLKPGQFEQVAAQEDGRGLQPPSIDWELLKAVGHVALFPDGVYGELVYCGDDEEGVPYVSFTSGYTPTAAEYAVPPAKYLQTIALGIMSVHGLSVRKAARYFANKIGIKGKLSTRDIKKVIKTKP